VDEGVDIYYCWICECEKKQQELPVLKGNSSALNHTMSHGYGREGNKIEKSRKTVVKATELYILVTDTRSRASKPS
jgi:hypothetical protein